MAETHTSHPDPDAMPAGVGETPRAYYNDNEPYAAAWLRNLIAEGLIAPGDVDDRSIADVQPSDLAGYTQCHFFAGLGGWSFAARLAGWPDNRPVWTGSCPCQPFSPAGNQEGFNDPRDLWPQFRQLVSKRCPSVVFGEQSAAAAAWLRRLRGDLEALGYAVGAVPVEAASAGADHFRDRYWFVADDDIQCSGEGRLQRRWQLGGPGSNPQNIAGFVEHLPGLGWGKGWAEHEFRSWGITAAVAGIGNSQFVECPDGKWRRLPPPRVRWLGTRIPARIPKLRAIGNAIDPRPAAAFISAYMDARAAA